GRRAVLRPGQDGGTSRSDSRCRTKLQFPPQPRPREERRCPPNGIGHTPRSRSEKAGRIGKAAIAHLVTSATAYLGRSLGNPARKVVLCGLILLSGVYPLALAWRASERTTLRHALAWTFATWAAWDLAFFLADLLPGRGADLVRYLALCLTSCAAV